MTKYFFARTNRYGSETSVGFDNTFEALAFFDRASRDAYVAEHADRNLAVKALTKAEALKLADRNDGTRYLATVDGGMVAIA